MHKRVKYMTLCQANITVQCTLITWGSKHVDLQSVRLYKRATCQGKGTIVLFLLSGSSYDQVE